jgi:hypothetical protein
MRLDKVFLSHFLIVFLSLTFFGQSIDDETNWFKEIGRGDSYYSRFDFRKYTSLDVEKAKARYFRISSEQSVDPWAGSYSMGTMLGNAEIIWNGKHGFVYHYVYHTLASIDYGSVVTRGDSVWFVSERHRPRNRNRFFNVEHIKVKFGERHLLVPKARLEDFAILAAGLEVPQGRRKKEIELEESFFWEKTEDEAKSIADYPTYPSKLAHLIRKPIQTQVASVGSLRVKHEKSAMWGTTSEDHLRSLTLLSGARQGVKVGMHFWVDDLEEWIEVVSVRPHRSVAELTRPFFDGKEYCTNYDVPNDNSFPCRTPKAGMTARTKPQYF